MYTLALRMLREVDLRLNLKLANNLMLGGFRSLMRFKRAAGRAESFPPFVFISVTNACNLRCTGCWVDVDGAAREMPSELLEKIIRECAARGNRFFGIMGGEPLLYPDLLTVLGKFPECYFQVFTNGTLVDRGFARALRRLGNVTPLVSIEGLEETSAKRRNAGYVFQRSVAALGHFRAERLFFGVASSVCRQNYAEVLTDDFVDDVRAAGAHYLWYYVYHPTGARPCPELALSREEIVGLRRFVVARRARNDLAIIDAAWDRDGAPLCPAGIGVSHHINPDGYVEPCPIVQFARDRITSASDVVRTIGESEYLRDVRALIRKTTAGCILLDNPSALAAFVRSRGATASSGRDGFAELDRMTRLPDHDTGALRIPEKSFFYRLAKTYWFFGFGAYG